MALQFQTPSEEDEQHILRDDTREAIARSLAGVDVITQRAERAEASAVALSADVSRLNATIEALQSKVSDIDSEMRTVRLERDQAIRERLVLETLFGHVRVILDQAAVPADVLRIERAPSKKGRK